MPTIDEIERRLAALESSRIDWSRITSYLPAVRSLLWALVGKVGDKGKVFYIGDKFHGSANQEGKLFLQITPSPWNNVSSGSYRIKVKVQGK